MNEYELSTEFYYISQMSVFISDEFKYLFYFS